MSKSLIRYLEKKGKLAPLVIPQPIVVVEHHTPPGLREQFDEELNKRDAQHRRELSALEEVQRQYEIDCESKVLAKLEAFVEDGLAFSSGSEDAVSSRTVSTESEPIPATPPPSPRESKQNEPQKKLSSPLPKKKIIPKRLKKKPPLKPGQTSTASVFRAFIKKTNEEAKPQPPASVVKTRWR